MNTDWATYMPEFEHDKCIITIGSGTTEQEYAAIKARIAQLVKDQIVDAWSFDLPYDGPPQIVLQKQRTVRFH